jgi:tRNA(Ile2) C34 agmatinyltransferase TiaS
MGWFSRKVKCPECKRTIAFKGGPFQCSFCKTWLKGTVEYDDAPAGY